MCPLPHGYHADDLTSLVWIGVLGLVLVVTLIVTYFVVIMSLL